MYKIINRIEKSRKKIGLSVKDFIKLCEKIGNERKE